MQNALENRLLQFKRLELLLFFIIVKLEAGVTAALQPLQGNVVASTDLSLQLLV